MDLEVTFLGTGGSVPSARRSTASVLVARGGVRMLFDCGEGTQRQMQRSLGLVQADEIYLTHFHADHVLGLPGLIKTYDLTDREVPLRIYGPPGLGDLFAIFKPFLGRLGFALELEELKDDGSVGHHDFEVRAFETDHRGARSSGYAIVEDDRPGPLRPRGRQGRRRRRRPRFRGTPAWGGGAGQRRPGRPGPGHGAVAGRAHRRRHRRHRAPRRRPSRPPPTPTSWSTTPPSPRKTRRAPPKPATRPSPRPPRSPPRPT